MSNTRIKQSLYQACIDQLDTQLADLEINLKSIIESRDNETKSSVGDKYETGRAMMQQEFQKVQAQQMRLQGSRNILSNLDLEKHTLKIATGSFVVTNHGAFFIAIGLGKVKFDDEVYFCVSIDSPIGASLKNKNAGDKFIFNGRNYEILSHH